MIYNRPQVTIDLDEYLVLKNVDASKVNILEVGKEGTIQVGTANSGVVSDVRIVGFSQDETTVSYKFSGMQSFILTIKKHQSCYGKAFK